MYSGKEFEEDFKKSWQNNPHGTSLVRLYDTTFGNKGVANPCDYVIGAKNATFWLELKTVKEKTFSFDNLSQNQYDSMLATADHSYYTHCGILVYYREPASLYYYDIHLIEEIKKAMQRKSINSVTMAHLGTPVKFRKKRVHIEIDTDHLFNEVFPLYHEGVIVYGEGQTAED